MCLHGKKTWREEEEITVNETATGTRNVGEYEVPVDPMDELECDSCQ